MQLSTPCNSCKTPIKIKSIAPSRPELEHELGEYFSVNCPECANNSKKHVNDVTAKEDQKIILIGIFVGLVLTIFLIFFVGLIAVFSFAIPAMVWQSQSNAAHTFNKYMLPRT